MPKKGYKQTESHKRNKIEKITGELNPICMSCNREKYTKIIKYEVFGRKPR
jgi:hypothetical protein